MLGLSQLSSKTKTNTNTNSNNTSNGISAGTSSNSTNGGLRKPISELPIRFRPIFEPYITLNHVQSLVFDKIMSSNVPIVVSAPTGSGKTGVFELAIIKMIMNSEQRENYLGAAKVIYLAPTKALCTERCNDWAKKFSSFNLECIELTSDMNATINFKSLQKSCILLATPEKWDSITRSWNGNKGFVQSIRLLLVDEVHLVNDGYRGATLEAVISRMKIIRSEIWPSNPENLRFLAVSATASNVEDIAKWLSSPTSIADVFQVDPKERPVKLRTFVQGYSIHERANEFQFDNTLNHKLPEVVKEYSNGKPTLIFCCTRKATTSAAITLVKEGKFDLSFSNEKRKHYLTVSCQIRDKTLQETTRMGVGFHHAGLTAFDRRLIERSFIEGKLFILCCTSTLALGVNLPAHLVIIKNTVFFDDGKFKPYPESSLVQMMGRAGRPQYDTEATAVIMTRTTCRDNIEKMLTGSSQIDSHLHKHLTEHLNSEIVLGTITDDAIARRWIDSTFLHVRIMKNPENYGMSKNCPSADIEATIINCVSNSIKRLLEHGMTERTKQGLLAPTDAGRAMAKHYVCLDTMIKITTMKGTESVWNLITIIATTHEASSDIQIRGEDKSMMNKMINPEDERMKLRYALGDKVDTREKKVAFLIQATFGNIPITETTLFQESLRVMKNATRVINCMRDVYFVSSIVNYQLLKNILILSQSFAAKLWDDSIYVSRQIEKIGAILSQNLAQNGLISFHTLKCANPRNIEIFCNRLPPFGSKVQQTCFGLPVYIINVSFNSASNLAESVQMIVEVTLENGEDMRNATTLPGHSVTLLIGSLANDKILMKQRLMDRNILNSADMTSCFGCDLSRADIPNDSDIEAVLISDSFVGLNATQTVRYLDPEPYQSRMTATTIDPGRIPAA